MSKPACYRCPTHGRVAVPTAGKTKATAPCPDCGIEMKRAPFEQEDLCFVAVPTATKRRLKEHAQLVGISIGQLIAALSQNLGGAS